ncbi:MAG: ABC transporter ATP-binding protein [Candidatus Dormibacteraeota bacterium]|nr:ABC transporter ATP-binding protein [Candidatus Dormibacteraeota bacterium]
MTEAAVAGTAVATGPVLEVEDLWLAFRVRGSDRPAIHGVSFSIARGESFGLVGESGCGKSTVALAAVRYLARNAKITAGSVRVTGRDLVKMNEPELRRMRATTVRMIYQNAGAALNPAIRIGAQVAEVFRIGGASASEAQDRARGMLEKVRISDPGGVMHRYPHQLSGGMQQRIVIAMALAPNPELLILDEPTTALDATVEAEVLDLVTALRAEYGTTLLFISHNLGVISRMCERVGVLYAGRMVEEGETETVFADPRHPYTIGLLRCVPRWGSRKDEGLLDTIPGLPPAVGVSTPGCVFADRCPLVVDHCRQEHPPLFDVGPGHTSRCFRHEEARQLLVAKPPALATTVSAGTNGNGHAVVSIDGVSKTFRQEGHDVQGLVDVTLQIGPGEALGLVGESGSGKSTLAKVLLGLLHPDTGGELSYEGKSLSGNIGGRNSEQVGAIQIVFQNPGASLNRRHAIRRIVGRAVTKLTGLTGGRREQRLVDLVGSVRLDRSVLDSKPEQLSGGLKQRVAIARAFAGDPRVVVCDEPTSALDVSVQAAILNLLVDLQRSKGVSYLFISHDLGVVRYLADRIAVLYLGRLLEVGTAEKVFSGPHHPYTEALLSAAPILHETKARIRLEGELPSAANPPSGCVFHTRCPRFLGEICVNQEPELVEVEPGHMMRCHIPIEELRVMQHAGAPTVSR